MSILKRGVSGEPVKRLQQKLGVTADGQFGPGTETALKAYQQQHGLKVDGIAGPDTFAAMDLDELILLRVGTSGDQVKKLQTALGISADGRFGPGTEKAVRDYQTSKGLSADGMAGPMTLATMPAFANQFPPAVVQASQIPASMLPGLPDIPPPDEVTAQLMRDLQRPAPPAGAPAPAPGAPAPVQADAAPQTRSIWASIRGLFGR